MASSTLFGFNEFVFIPISLYSESVSQNGSSPAKVRDYILSSNGMRVLMLQRPNSPFVSAGWVVNVGSVNESPGITGIAHLFEHMMFKGTSKIGTTNYPQEKELMSQQTQLFNRIRSLRHDIDYNNQELGKEKKERLAELEQQLLEKVDEHSRYIKKSFEFNL